MTTTAKLDALSSSPATPTTKHAGVLGAAPTGDRLRRMREAPQWKNGVFVNARPVRMMEASRTPSVMRAWWESRATREPREELPIFDDTARVLAAPTDGLRVTWLGHSTNLVEIDGARFLTDPVFCERASPSQAFGPRRFHRVPMSLDALPRLDAILLSHDHYDHLDFSTMRALASSTVPIVTALGVGAHLEAWGIAQERIVELEWWEETRFGDVCVVATPSQHFSGRSMNDRNRTHWMSFSVVGPRHRAFFSGDTGYSTVFEEIGRRIGGFDVAMLEVGAYHEAWGDIHLGPENAERVFAMLDARTFLPVHWSTFALGPHAWDEPGEQLARKAESSTLPLLTPRIGEPIMPRASTSHLRAWWRDVA